MANKSQQKDKLAGKVAVITGASKGIGASIAEHFALAGASVVVNYASSKQNAERLVSNITKNGGKAIAVQADVSKEGDVIRLFAETKKAYGRLDILVNNAGIYEFQPLENITAEHYHKQFDLNVLGLILCCREAAKLIDKNATGSIINISSVVSQAPAAQLSVYSASKAAVDAMTQALAKELGPRKIRVNCIRPGTTVTEGTHAAGLIGSSFEQKIVDQTPLGRLGQPEDVARVALFFASDDSQWVTGECLLVSGGSAN